MVWEEVTDEDTKIRPYEFKTMRLKDGDILVIALNKYMPSDAMARMQRNFAEEIKRLGYRRVGVSVKTPDYDFEKIEQDIDHFISVDKVSDGSHVKALAKAHEADMKSIEGLK